MARFDFALILAASIAAVPFPASCSKEAAGDSKAAGLSYYVIENRDGFNVFWTPGENGLPGSSVPGETTLHITSFNSCKIVCGWDGILHGSLEATSSSPSIRIGEAVRTGISMAEIPLEYVHDGEGTITIKANGTEKKFMFKAREVILPESFSVLVDEGTPGEREMTFPLTDEDSSTNIIDFKTSRNGLRNAVPVSDEFERYYHVSDFDLHTIKITGYYPPNASFNALDGNGHGYYNTPVLKYRYDAGGGVLRTGKAACHIYGVEKYISENYVSKGVPAFLGGKGITAQVGKTFFYFVAGEDDDAVALSGCLYSMREAGFPAKYVYLGLNADESE